MLKALTGVLRYFVTSISGERASEFYKIPQEYYYDNIIHDFLSIVIIVATLIFMLSTPLILKKMSEKYKFKITKIDSILYASAVLIYTLLAGIILLYEVHENWLKIALFIVLLLVSCTLGTLTYNYLSLSIRGVNIKDNNRKKFPEVGYKFITFDFNGGKYHDELKDRVRYQIPIGSKVSDAVLHLEKIHPLKEIKKDGEQFLCWADNINSIERYNDEVITENFDNNRILYAQYSNKKNKERWILSAYLLISILAFFASLALTWRIVDYKTDPANKVTYEVVPYDDGTRKAIVGQYNGDAMLKDCKLVDDPGSKEQKIELVRDGFYIDSIKGKKITVEKCNLEQPEKTDSQTQ